MRYWGRIFFKSPFNHISTIFWRQKVFVSDKITKDTETMLNSSPTPPCPQPSFIFFKITLMENPGVSTILGLKACDIKLGVNCILGCRVTVSGVVFILTFFWISEYFLTSKSFFFRQNHQRHWNYVKLEPFNFHLVERKWKLHFPFKSYEHICKTSPRWNKGLPEAK